VSTIAFKFLTSETQYTVEVPDFVNKLGEYYGVVTSDFAIRSIQFSPDGLYNLELQVGEPFAGATVGGTMPTLYRTVYEPIFPVIVWPLTTGKLWVSVDSALSEEVALLAGAMAVSEDTAGAPHVEFLAGLAGGNIKDPVQREAFILADVYGDSIGVEFVDAGPFAADMKVTTGGVYAVTLATPFGIAVRCSGDVGVAATVDEAVASIASSVAVVSPARTVFARR
jgi:hypothetical protein